MRKMLVVTVFLLLPYLCFGQGIRGLVVDEKRVPIPFATIYVENLKIGSSSNINGKFEVKLSPGKYTVLFRSLGYQQVKKEVVVGNEFLSMNVEMNTESYQIKEVVISAKSEDPAYAIMRRVIAWAPYHLNQLKHYQSEVYLKGTLIMDKIPKLLAKQMTIEEDGKQYKIKSGDVYLDESVNDITFDAPNKYNQKVKSMRSTFPGKSNQPVTPIEFIKASFYQPEILEQISPISPRSFSHYRFSYEGCSKEGDYLIDKIKVIPRRESQKLFSGYIYVVEQYWSLHSVDLKNEQFWGSISIRQMFSPIVNDAWLPVSHTFNFEASMLGVKGRYNYISTVKFSDLQINEKLKGPVVAKINTKDDEVTESKMSKEKQDLLTKKEFTRRDFAKLMKESRKEERKIKRDTVKSLEIKEKRSDTKIEVDSMASRLDTSYWNKIRPVPLTIEEVKSNRIKDSVTLTIQPKQAKDTLRKKNKTKIPGPVRDILMGTTKYYKTLYSSLNYSGVFTSKHLGFNTVDGFVYGQSLKWNAKIDSVHSLSISPVIQYAFNRKVLMGNIDGKYDYAPLNRGLFYFSAGSKSSDFNQFTGENPIINSLASLFFRYNYMKLFENKFVKVGNGLDLMNGLRSNFEVNYHQTSVLENYSDFSFFYKNKRDFLVNIPQNDFFNNAQPLHNKSFDFSASLSYTPEYFYKIEKFRKRMMYSNYPTFSVNYKGGFEGVLNSQTSFHQLEFRVHQDLKLPGDDHLKYFLEAGTFWNVKSIHFLDFKHFNTQPIPVQFGNVDNSFQLLDFYTYSTTQRYLEGHVSYRSDLLLLKRFPWISNTVWQENVYFNYLNTTKLRNYMEVGYGVSQIYFVGNVSIFGSFESGKYRSVGLKIGFFIK